MPSSHTSIPASSGYHSHMSSGTDLIGALSEHVLEAMRRLPDCERIRGIGAAAGVIQAAADLDLGLSEQNGWLTWSILQSLASSGRVEITTTRPRRYRSGR